MNPEAMFRFIESIGTAFKHGDQQVKNKDVEAENVHLLQEQYRALSRGDIAAFAELLSEDVELEIIAPPELPFAGRWSGKKSVLQAVAKNFSLLADQRPEVLSVVAQGDTVMVFARERGRVKSSGQEYDIHWMQRFTFIEGLLRKMTEIAESASLIAAFRMA